ncbi:MAG: hypothetical protein HRT56_08975 [Coraliomargarita sp.]|nr:hypothetical protein [Coraliomargarita sp.]
MHITSDYYRKREQQALVVDPIAERWISSVRRAAQAAAGGEAKPLRPSARTLQGLARCHKQTHSKRIA